MEGTLVGGRVQRLALGRVGDRAVALVQVRVPRQTVHVVVASGLGVGALDPSGRERLRARLSATASPAQASWRSRLDGARIEGVHAGQILVFRETALRIRDDGRALVLDADAAAGAPDVDLTVDALIERGRGMLETIERSGEDESRTAVARGLARAAARIERRVERIRGDLEKMAGAQAAAQQARAFVAEAARAPRGASVLRAVDWSSGEAREIELRLDPAKGAREQIDAIFKRARRLKDGAAIAQARLDDATASSERLRDLRAALAAPGADPEAVVAEARAAAPRDFKLSSPGPGAASETSAQGPRPPYRRFVGASGAAILVGRNAQHNDALTLRVARPWDSWLHAKNRAGAHVVVPLSKGASLPADVLVEAAHLAAHFSDAPDEAVVEVTYTPRRYVRKPRGAAPGAVVVDREKVIALRRDETVLRRLLASEVEEGGPR
jgi:hypothetical protein